MTSLFADNPDYCEYERLLTRLHELIASGDGGSDEADALRDRMDGPWRRLTDEEIKRLGGLSADLYMFGNQEIPEQVDPSERGPETLGITLLEARRRGDWAQILELLRKGPDFLPKPIIAFLRGLSYLQLGHPRPALLFFDYAAELTPQDELYHIFSLDALKRLGKHDEVLARAKQYISSNVGLALAVHSMSEVYQSTRALSEPDAKPIYEDLIKMLCDKLPQDRTGAVDPEIAAFGFLLLGACLESVGRYEEALEAYDSSGAVDPLAQDAYIAKGALLEKIRNPRKADADLAAGSVRHRENRFKIVLNPPLPVKVLLEPLMPVAA